MATILEGLNAISQAVGGTGEAESNLEALNQISEALGGSADATENAEAIANIAENASGGGGGMFKFTVTNMSSSVITIPAMVQTVPTYEVNTVAGGNSAKLELPVVDGIVKVRLTGAGTFGETSKGCTYRKGLLTITEDDATAIFM